MMLIPFCLFVALTATGTDSGFGVTITEIVAMIFIFSWFYAMGNGLYAKAECKDKRNLIWFGIAIACVMLSYIAPFLVPYFGIHVANPIMVWSAIILTVLYFYSVIFVAKILQTVELQKVKREVKFSDYAGEFFALLYFPIGLWWIQPRINKIFSKDQAYPI